MAEVHVSDCEDFFFFEIQCFVDEFVLCHDFFCIIKVIKFEFLVFGR